MRWVKVEQKAIKTFSISQYLTKVFYANVHRGKSKQTCKQALRHDMKGAMMILQKIHTTLHSLGDVMAAEEGEREREYETEQAKVVILIQVIDFLCAQTFITSIAFVSFLERASKRYTHRGHIKRIIKIR